MSGLPRSTDSLFSLDVFYMMERAADQGRTRGIDRYFSERMGYEMDFYSDGATFHANEGEAQPGRLALGAAGATQLARALPNAEWHPACRWATGTFDLKQHDGQLPGPEPRLKRRTGTGVGHVPREKCMQARPFLGSFQPDATPWFCQAG